MWGFALDEPLPSIDYLLGIVNKARSAVKQEDDPAALEELKELEEALERLRIILFKLRAKL
jgi:hypothetical protein